MRLRKTRPPCLVISSSRLDLDSNVVPISLLTSDPIASSQFPQLPHSPTIASPRPGLVTLDLVSSHVTLALTSPSSTYPCTSPYGCMFPRPRSPRHQRSAHLKQSITRIKVYRYSPANERPLYPARGNIPKHTCLTQADGRSTQRYATRCPTPHHVFSALPRTHPRGQSRVVGCGNVS